MTLCGSTEKGNSAKGKGWWKQSRKASWREGLKAVSSSSRVGKVEREEWARDNRQGKELGGACHKSEQMQSECKNDGLNPHSNNWHRKEGDEQREIWEREVMGPDWMWGWGGGERSPGYECHQLRVGMEEKQLCGKWWCTESFRIWGASGTCWKTCLIGHQQRDLELSSFRWWYGWAHQELRSPTKGSMLWGSEGFGPIQTPLPTHYCVTLNKF